MLDGICKYCGLPFAVFLSVLLTTEHYGFCAVHLVDAVDDGIQPAHFLKLLGIYVEQVLLDGAVGPDTHDYYACFLVVIALAVGHRWQP